MRAQEAADLTAAVLNLILKLHPEIFQSSVAPEPIKNFVLIFVYKKFVFVLISKLTTSKTSSTSACSTRRTCTRTWAPSRRCLPAIPWRGSETLNTRVMPNILAKDMVVTERCPVPSLLLVSQMKL